MNRREQNDKDVILIAEDEQYTRDTLSFVLENAGYRVIETSNGQDALQRILACRQAAQPITLLILDIEIPGISGLQILNELQDRQADIPTIVITGLNDLPKFQDKIGRTTVEYLKKPFTPNILIARVAETLESAGSRISIV